MKRIKRHEKNYDLLSGHSHFIPGPGEILILTILLLVGALIGNVVGFLFLLCLPEAGQDAMMLISYPLMFIPPMMYAQSKSMRSSMFDEGVALDSENFGKPGLLGCSALVIAGTLALSFTMDGVNSLMPPMPEWLETALNSMVEGRVWMNFLCVSVFAPFFEEWLCRGMVLRGLLNYSRKDGQYGIKPAYAIVLSSLFFGLIHLNPWQALPAFALGCLFGYVYYRTGSLKLTMLMHFTNNTFALIFSNIDSLKDYESFVDAMPLPAYLGIAAVCVAMLVFIIRAFSRIELQEKTGNCDKIEVQNLI
ncbi:MAG: lysostaphin resistance A-like protein [Candidatus Cryptobacteroides sp.]